MRWWLRTRRCGTVVLALLTTVGAAALLGDRVVGVPVLVGVGEGQVLLVTFVQLIWAAALADAFAARSQALDARPVPGRFGISRLALLDAALFIAGTAAAAAAFTAVVSVRGEALAGAGSLVAVSAIVVTGTLLAGPGPGVLAVTSLLVLSAVYGPTASGASVVRIVEIDGDPGLALGCGLALSAAVVGLLLRDRVRTRLSGADRL